MDEAGQKRRLRRRALRQRQQIDAADAATSAAQIADRVLAHPAWEQALTVHTYVSSLPGEVDTHRLIDHALEQSKRVVVPVVVGLGQPLRHAEIAGLDELAPARWNLLQPSEPRFVDAADTGLVLVPGVLFDVHGYRVGHGGGFYDRFLLGLADATRIGLIYDEFLVDRIPIEDHDVPVDVVITPSGVHPRRVST